MNSNPKAQTSPLSAEDRRKVAALRRRMQRYFEGSKATALELVEIYATRGMDEQARMCAKSVMDSHDDPSGRAAACLSVGVRMERAARFDLAVWAYSNGVALEPTEPGVWYWLNNNLGFSLNQLGQHAQAEARCRSAIRSQPHQYNAHKNLGVSLEGEGSILAAAKAYVLAVQLDSVDQRALCHLLQLSRTHGEELKADAPGVMAFVEERERALRERVESQSETPE